jgi:hypothetical protein
MHNLRRAVGVVLLPSSLLMLPVLVLGLIDPVGLKHADDSNPFGQPPSRTWLLVSIGLVAAVGGVGMCLAVRKPERRNVAA